MSYFDQLVDTIEGAAEPMQYQRRRRRTADEKLRRKLIAIALLDSAAEIAAEKRNANSVAEFLSAWTTEDILAREG